MKKEIWTTILGKKWYIVNLINFFYKNPFQQQLLKFSEKKSQ